MFVTIRLCFLRESGYLILCFGGKRRVNVAPSRCRLDCLLDVPASFFCICQKSPSASILRVDGSSKFAIFQSAVNIWWKTIQSSISSYCQGMRKSS